MKKDDVKSFMQAFEHQSMPVALISQEGQYLYMNQKERSIRGLNEALDQDLSIFDALGADYSTQIKQALDAVMMYQKPSHAFFHETGGRHFEITFSASLFNTIVVVSTELSNEKTLMRLLDEAANDIQRLNDAIEGANIGCWDFFPQEERIVANKTWVTQKQYLDEQFRVNPDAQFSDVISGLDRWASLVHPNDHRKTVDAIKKHLDGETESYNAVFRMKFGDGRWHWINDIGKVFLRDEDGKAVRMNGVHIDITEQKEMELKIASLLNFDELTGLKNRRALKEEFSKVIKESLQGHRWVAFIMMDIDYFKLFNDTYGHFSGDQVLRDIGQLLKNFLQRENDVCFRLGGEEFGVLFSAEDCASANQFAEEMRLQIENLHIPHSKNKVSEFVTASLGVCCQPASLELDIDKIYKKADEYLYVAKSSGRNCVFGQQ